MRQVSLESVLLVAALMIGFVPIEAQTTETHLAEQQIRAVLQSQVEAWNRGNLEQFMAGYWNSPELTFFSGAAATHGWQPTLDRYRKTYQSGGHAMGTLSFSDLRIETLGPDAGFARGGFELVMPDGKHPHGIFTLVFRRFAEGWRIIHDHTCAAPD